MPELTVYPIIPQCETLLHMNGLITEVRLSFILLPETLLELVDIICKHRGLAVTFKTTEGGE